MRTFPITVTVQPEGINVNPTYVNVPNDPSTEVNLKWTVIGATLPTSGCFSWKSSPTGAPAVACPTSAGQTVIESAGYRNDFPDRRLWQYSITIIVNEKPVTIDPEVNNEPPTP